MKRTMLALTLALTAFLLSPQADASCAAAAVHECVLEVKTDRFMQWDCGLNQSCSYVPLDKMAQVFSHQSPTRIGAKAGVLNMCINRLEHMWHISPTYRMADGTLLESTVRAGGTKGTFVDMCKLVVKENPGSLKCELGKVVVCDQPEVKKEI